METMSVNIVEAETGEILDENTVEWEFNEASETFDFYINRELVSDEKYIFDASDGPTPMYPYYYSSDATVRNIVDFTFGTNEFFRFCTFPTHRYNIVSRGSANYYEPTVFNSLGTDSAYARCNFSEDPVTVGIHPKTKYASNMFVQVKTSLELDSSFRDSSLVNMRDMFYNTNVYNLYIPETATDCYEVARTANIFNVDSGEGYGAYGCRDFGRAFQESNIYGSFKYPMTDPINAHHMCWNTNGLGVINISSNLVNGDRAFWGSDATDWYSEYGDDMIFHQPIRGMYGMFGNTRLTRVPKNIIFECDYPLPTESDYGHPEVCLYGGLSDYYWSEEDLRVISEQTINIHIENWTFSDYIAKKKCTLLEYLSASDSDDWDDVANLWRVPYTNIYINGVAFEKMISYGEPSYFLDYKKISSDLWRPILNTGRERGTVQEKVNYILV